MELLLIEKGGVSHYCLIKNLSGLVSSQICKHNGKSFLCERCLNHFQDEDSLNTHEEYFSKNECVKIVMPKKGTILKLKNYRSLERVPFMIYADIESLIR